VKGHRKAWHGADARQREGERASSRKERELARGTDKVGLAEGGCPRDLSGHGNNVTKWGYSPLETAEEGIRRDTGRM